MVRTGSLDPTPYSTGFNPSCCQCSDLEIQSSVWKLGVHYSCEMSRPRFRSETNSDTEGASLVPRPIPPFPAEKQGYTSDRKLSRQLGTLYDIAVSYTLPTQCQ